MLGRLRAQLLSLMPVLIGTAGGALAGEGATQHVSIAIQPIDEILLSGERPRLVIDTAEAGAGPVAVEADGGGYAITTNGEQRKITASLGAALPPGVILSMRMSAPSRGRSTGWQALRLAPAEMVTGIARVAESGLGIRYRLEARADAGEVTARTETVSVTLIDGL